MHVPALTVYSHYRLQAQGLLVCAPATMFHVHINTTKHWYTVFETRVAQHFHPDIKQPWAYCSHSPIVLQVKIVLLKYINTETKQKHFQYLKMNT